MNYDAFFCDTDMVLTPDGKFIDIYGVFNNNGKVRLGAIQHLQSEFNKSVDDKMDCIPNPHTGDVTLVCRYGSGKTVSRGAKIVFLDVIKDVDAFDAWKAADIAKIVKKLSDYAAD